jgi:hypothetical protein
MPEPLCEPAPYEREGWRHGTVPGTSAGIGLPPTYLADANGWRTPDSNWVAVTTLPHAFQVGLGVADGSRCVKMIAQRLVQLSSAVEVGTTGLRYVTSARWEESLGVDIAIQAVATTEAARREQIAMIYSLNR